MQTITQQLNVKDFPFKIRDKNERIIYCESFKGYWHRYEYDLKGNEIYYEDSNGYWIKKEYDSKGKGIYFESSYGPIIDRRPKSEIQKALELLEKEGMIVDGKVLKN